ncbi:MAG: MFS transporter, partial [Proteobacteria bacterium]|nr:MFS transporter [Pseudomonadota bacterium]
MFKSVLLFILAALFLFFEMALQVSPGIMTENLMISLHIDIFWLGVTSGAYFITYTLMQIPAGLIYDRFSARNVIMLPLLICVIGGFLFGLAPNFYLAACARIFMGFGSAFAFI